MHTLARTWTHSIEATPTFAALLFTLASFETLRADAAFSLELVQEVRLWYRTKWQGENYIQLQLPIIPHGQTRSQDKLATH